MNVAIGVDVGTTGARAVAVGEDGVVVASLTAGYPLLTPRPRWTEQDPEAWWRAAREVLAAVAERCRSADHAVPRAFPFVRPRRGDSPTRRGAAHPPALRITP